MRRCGRSGGRRPFHTGGSVHYRLKMIIKARRGLVTVLAVLGTAAALLTAAGPASADPAFEVGNPTVAITRLGLHGGYGYLTIDARTDDSTFAVLTHLPAGGGTWTIAPTHDCSGSRDTAGTLTVSCTVPRAGSYHWSVLVRHVGGSVTGLTGSAKSAYPEAFTGPTLDTFPVVDLDAPVSGPAVAIRGITAEVRELTVTFPSSSPNGAVGAGDVALTLDVPAGTSAYTADVRLPIVPGVAWSATSLYPVRAQRWVCSLVLISPADSYQSLSCFSYDPAVGLIPMLPGVHTLVMHLHTIGRLPDTAVGSVALYPSRSAAPVVVDTFPIVYRN